MYVAPNMHLHSTIPTDSYTQLLVKINNKFGGSNKLHAFESVLGLGLGLGLILDIAAEKHFGDTCHRGDNCHRG